MCKRTDLKIYGEDFNAVIITLSGFCDFRDLS